MDVRKGLTGKGAFLVTTSKPERTSPVTRGKWVMTNILGMSPPDPPADVPPLPPRAADPNAKEPSMRQKMMDHRVRPDCVQCHQLMDPIGFALETFDGIGLVRSHDEGTPVDAKARTFDNTQIEGPGGVRNWLAGNYSKQFVAVAAEKLLTYGLGRGLDYRDMPLVRTMARDAAPVREPLLGAGARRRQEPAVPDEYALGAGGHDHGLDERVTRTSDGTRRIQSCSSPRGTSGGGRSCRARAPRWRCRCWTRWCPRASCWRRRRPTPRRASSASSFRTAWRPATGSPRLKARCRRSCPTSSSRWRR